LNKRCLKQIKSFILNTIVVKETSTEFSSKHFPSEGEKLRFNTAEGDSENESWIGNHNLTFTSYMFLKQDSWLLIGELFCALHWHPHPRLTPARTKILVFPAIIVHDEKCAKGKIYLNVLI